MTDSKAAASYPGVYIEEIRTSVKVIPGVGASQPAVIPSALIADGYEVVEASIQPGGLALLLGKGADLVLFRMVDFREGGSIEGQLAVTFSAKVP
jgi:hypothetical protein